MTIARVSGQAGGASTPEGAGTSVSKAFANPLSVGSLVAVVGMATGSPAQPLASGQLTQSAGTATLGAFSQHINVSPVVDGASSCVHLSIWSAIVTGAGTCTLLISGRPNNNTIIIGIDELTGSWDSSRFDTSNSASTGSDGATAITSGAVTSAGAGVMLAGAMSLGPNNVPYTDDASFSSIYKTSGAYPAACGSTILRIVTSATTETANWTKTGSDSGCAGAIVVLKETAGPSISGGTANPVHLSTGNTITGTTFGASQGTGGLVIGGQAQTITAWSDTSITYTANRGVNLNDVAVNAVVTADGGAVSGDYALTGFDPPAGWLFVTLASVWATPAERLQSSPDLAIGNQIEWDDATIQVTDSGVPIWPPGTPAGYTFNFRVGVTGDGFGATGVATLNPVAAGGAGTTGRRRMQLKLGF